MTTNRQHISALWERYLTGQATPEEVRTLLDLLKDPRNDVANDLQFQQALAAISSTSIASTDPVAFEAAWQSLLDSRADLQADWKERQATTLPPAIPVMPSPKLSAFRKWGWAAAVLFVFGTGTYLWITHKKVMSPSIVAAKPIDIAPGQEGAILTLADGSQVLLDSIRNATVALQGGVTAKVVNGTLLYEGKGDEVVYNTMTTPKGRQFPLTLPDGTKVWLNAASSIHYPTLFTGKQRRVRITGEAYFEVMTSPMPFVVDADSRGDIQVLGTHFNVNSYANEVVLKTTLLEGSVEVSKGNERVRLSPGDQAQVTNGISISKDVAIEKVMAWKNGFIYFEGATLDAIMRQLERWYDIAVVYENNKIPNKQLEGGMSRDVPLKGLLKNLEDLGVRYKLDGRTLMVLQ